MTFSIIVPVYNTERYLRRCVSSLLPALEAGDEILLSLGHSADDSEKLARELAAEHDNIRWLYQDSTGLGDARNSAIAVAEGDHIVCVDSDDYVLTERFRALLSRMRREDWSEDLVFCDYFRQSEGEELQPAFFFGDREDLLGSEHLPELLKNRRNFCNVWRYIYKTSFLKRNHISYDGQRLAEDVDYTTSVYLAQPSVRYTHNPYYVYTSGRSGSLMDVGGFRRLKETTEILLQSIGRLRASSLPFAEAMVAQLQYEYVLLTALAYEVDAADRRSGLQLLSDTKDILLPSADPRVVLCARWIRCFGMRSFALTMHGLKRAKHALKKRKKEG